METNAILDVKARLIHDAITPGLQCHPSRIVAACADHAESMPKRHDLWNTGFDKDVIKFLK